MLEVLLNRLEKGQNTVLIAITHSKGSVPRGEGAWMLCTEEGYLLGTVGGGAIEYEALRLAKAVFQSGKPFTKTFSLSNEQAGSLGMVCGGEATLLFNLITGKDKAAITGALEKMAGQDPVYWQMDAYSLCLKEKGMAYIFGGGHVAKALVPLMLEGGFPVTVIDDRDAFLAFDGAGTRLMDFEEAETLKLTKWDSALIMTRGHQHDLTVLKAMLKTPARYIGMMGSRKKRAAVYNTLKEAGFGEKDFARVHSPIGLDIGAETPFEIAISILAELIGEKNR